MTHLLARRGLFHATAGGLCLSALGPNALGGRAMAATPADWSLYRQRYVRADGRVVDTGNGGASHSEGQGYGLLFAQAFNDQPMFDTMAAWTCKVLKRNEDALHAWHYLPGSMPHVPDHNNATDGDLLIALALTLAGRKWNRPDLTDAARAIYAALRGRIVAAIGGRKVLLPGLYGFSTPDAATVNLSYYVMPSLMAAAELDDRETWLRVIRDGLALIHQAGFGRWNLPPDWIQVAAAGGAVSIARPQPPRFSFDAVRVPLYLQWAGLLDPGLRVVFRTYWNAWGAGTMPAWVNLRNGERSPYNAPPGFYAVGIASGLLNMPGTATVDFPAMAASPDYYSASLTMLSSLVLDGMASEIVQHDGGMF
ncbi:glycosyl hydrolase family 8 [Gluconacetobacter takamatsuzukensis]|uniref:cellulase n=1 Tax=Gluconacetobacter takamatsuzukensis TaxID=1286190 RepID=A0A7W4KES5_9PROT|nr:glycosyl hydrolase family 8 [Gluconacetobacter takamatsuzukensis]MBB2205535.1 endoglucanase [Gluconacetobacter takamatsuzukensis]